MPESIVHAMTKDITLRSDDKWKAFGDKELQITTKYTTNLLLHHIYDFAAKNDPELAKKMRAFFHTMFIHSTGNNPKWVKFPNENGDIVIIHTKKDVTGYKPGESTLVMTISGSQKSIDITESQAVDEIVKYLLNENNYIANAGVNMENDDSKPVYELNFGEGKFDKDGNFSQEMGKNAHRFSTNRMIGFIAESLRRAGYFSADDAGKLTYDSAKMDKLQKYLEENGTFRNGVFLSCVTAKTREDGVIYYNPEFKGWRQLVEIDGKWNEHAFFIGYDKDTLAGQYSGYPIDIQTAERWEDAKPGKKPTPPIEVKHSIEKLKDFVKTSLDIDIDGNDLKSVNENLLNNTNIIQKYGIYPVVVETDEGYKLEYHNMADASDTTIFTNWVQQWVKKVRPDGIFDSYGSLKNAWLFGVSEEENPLDPYTVFVWVDGEEQPKALPMTSLLLYTIGNLSKDIDNTPLGQYLLNHLLGIENANLVDIMNYMHASPEAEEITHKVMDCLVELMKNGIC